MGNGCGATKNAVLSHAFEKYTLSTSKRFSGHPIGSGYFTDCDVLVRKFLAVLLGDVLSHDFTKGYIEYI